MARNRAEDINLFKENFEFSMEGDRYSYVGKSIDTNCCIFISHKHEDKEAAKQIADYIVKIAGVDIYLDQNDSGLQYAVSIGDDKKIVQAIEKGIAASTHVLCLVSDYTKNSWWVPYEIGYAKKASKNLNSLLLKNTKDIPSFLKIENMILGTKSLNNFLEKITTKRLIENNKFNHPLDLYIDWSK